MIIRYDVRVCTFCGSERVIFDEKRAELYCGKCGTVMSDRMLYSDLAENVLYSPKKKEVLFVLPNELRTLDERAMLRAYNDLNIIDNILNLRRYVRKEVLENYMKLFRKGKTERRDRMKMLGALILVVSRRDGLPYMDDDIAFACYCDVKSLMKTAREVAKRLGMRFKHVKPSYSLIPVAHGIGMSEQSITVAAAISEELSESGFMKHVISRNIAAVSLLLASEILHEKLDIMKLCEKMGLSRSTLYRLRDKVRKSISPDFFESYINI